MLLGQASIFDSMLRMKRFTCKPQNSEEIQCAKIQESTDHTTKTWDNGLLVSKDCRYGKRSKLRLSLVTQQCASSGALITPCLSNRGSS